MVDLVIRIVRATTMSCYRSPVLSVSARTLKSRCSHRKIRRYGNRHQSLPSTEIKGAFMVQKNLLPLSSSTPLAARRQPSHHGRTLLFIQILGPQGNPAENRFNQSHRNFLVKPLRSASPYFFRIWLPFVYIILSHHDFLTFRSHPPSF